MRPRRGLAAGLAFVLVGLCLVAQSESLAVRLHLADYVEVSSACHVLQETTGSVKLPMAFGFHARAGETIGFRRMLLHVHAEKEGHVGLTCNRIFEAIRPSRIGLPPIKPVEPVMREVKAGWNWLDFPYAGRREMRFELTATVPVACDIALLTKSAEFDPVPLSAADLQTRTAYRMPRTEFADRLFERRPLMPIADYVAAIAAHLGATPAQEVPLTDENGALLHEGKPFFPLMVFHSTFGEDEALFKDLPVNLYPDRIPAEKSDFPRWLHNNALAGTDTCYEDFAHRARNQDSNWIVRNTGVLYLFDEPDALYDPIALARMCRLVKCFVPQIPVSCCFCTFANPPEAYQACDCMSFDHYPIGMRDPWYSVEAIGWMVDKMRWSTGCAPVFATIQVFDQSDPGHYEGGNVNPTEGFPTEREMHAMAFLAIARGVRGLYFYNWRGLHNDHYESMARLHPEGFAAFRRLLFRLHDLRDCLIGPEFRLPWNMTGEGLARVLVSTDRKRGFLLVVNPTLHDVAFRLSAEGLALDDICLDPVFDFGVDIVRSSGAFILKMEELGSVLFCLRSDSLTKLERKTTLETVAELTERALSDSSRYTREATRLGRRGQRRSD